MGTGKGKGKRVRAHSDDWRRGLPLRLELYDTKTRADVEAACRGVLAQVPVPPPTPEPPNYEAVKEPKELSEALPRLVGIFGDPQAGKDMVVDYTVAHYAAVRHMAFSDVIFPEVNAYLALHPALVNGKKLRHVITHTNKTIPCYRRLLQAWGLARPQEDPDYWAKMVRSQIQAFWGEGARLVMITGVRLPPDVSLIQGLGGELWKVVRPHNPYAAEHDVEKQLANLSPDLFREIRNPVEGDIKPFEENILRALGDT